MTALELNSRVDNFVANWTGVKNGYFIVYTGQCVQIVNQYNQDVVNAPFMPTPVTMGARDVFEYWQGDKTNYYQRITNVANDPTCMPQKGDIIVWGAMGSNPYGHIAICLDANSMTFTSFDQNWPMGSACHAQPHNYNGVLGWLRPYVEADPIPEPVATPSLFEDCNKKVVTSKPCAIWDLSATTWPDFHAVDNLAQDQPYNVVQIYNHPLGGRYYIANAGELRGINVNDTNDEPLVTPVAEPIAPPSVLVDGQIVDVKVVNKDDWKKRSLFTGGGIAKEDYEVLDHAGVGRKLLLPKGYHVTGAATFTKNNEQLEPIIYLQRRKDVDAEQTDGTWYGIDLNALNMDLEEADTIMPGYKTYKNDDSDILHLGEEIGGLTTNTAKSIKQKIISGLATITGFFIRKKINKGE